MKEKGITLIALVITIIVLLILATVSIATLTGENGIIGKAREAKEKTEIAEVIEKAKMDLLEAQVQNDGSLTSTDLRTVLEKYFDDVPKILPDDLSTLTRKTKAEYGSHNITLSDVWNGTTSSVIEVLAKEVLKTDPTATDARTKSPYVIYNGMECRVLYNDEKHGLQIIAAESVETVTLASGDETVTASDFIYNGIVNLTDNFKKAAASYNYAVDHLNRKAKTYMDTKGIVVDARSLGSIPILTSDTKFQSDTSGMWSSDSFAYLTDHGWNNKFKTSDTNYSEDVNQLGILGLESTSVTWLASRYDIDSTYACTIMAMRNIDSSGNLGHSNFCSFFQDATAYDATISNGFRPVFLLSSDIMISNGDGSSQNPYVIK